MTNDPELERRLAARLRAELEREVGPRPTWAGVPVAISRARRWAMTRVFATAAVIATIAMLGAIVVIRTPSSASVTPLAATAAASSAPASERPSVPPGSFDVLLDGRAMQGDGWRLLAASLRVQGEPTPGPSSAGSIWAVSDPSILPKIWIAISRNDDPPAVDSAREVVVAIDMAVSDGPVCGRVVVDSVSFNEAEHSVTLQYEDASAVVPLPAPSAGLPSGTPAACSAVGIPALIVFALDRAHVPTGPISIRAVRGRGQLAAVTEARALLVLPAAPSGAPAAPIIDAGFVTAGFGWVETPTRLLVTEDGGATWRDATPPVSMGYGAADGVSFRDRSVGWLIHNDGSAGDGLGAKLSLWRTADGGRTWTSTRMPHASQGFEVLGMARIVWIDAEHVVVDLEGGMPNGYADDVFATADGGRTWPIAVNAGEGVTGTPVFADEQHGYLVGGAGGDRLYATRDGGRTWRRVLLPALADNPVPSLVGGRFFSPTQGRIFGTSDAVAGPLPVVFRTSDGGRTWEVGEITSSPAWGCSILSIDAWTCLDPASGFVTRWTDGGKAWAQGTLAGLPPNADAHLVDATHGWATDGQEDPGSLYLTTDGGATWQRTLPGA